MKRLTGILALTLIAGGVGLAASQWRSTDPAGNGGGSAESSSSHDFSSKVPESRAGGDGNARGEQGVEADATPRFTVSGARSPAVSNERPRLHLEGFSAFDRIPTQRIQSIVAEADADVSRAQYSLAKLMQACGHMVDLYPSESALADAIGRAKQAGDAEFAAGIERETSACWDLRDAYGSDDWDPSVWMLRAARGGYGPALAALAGAWAWGGPWPEPESTGELLERKEMQRTLVAAAIRTRDPNALFAIHGFFAPEGPLTRGKPGESLAWLYAACHYGLDCSRSNWYLEWMCRWGKDCDQAYATSLPAYLEYKQYSPAEQDYAARRAPELIRELEAGDWEALELEIEDDQTVVRALEKAAALQERAASERESLMRRPAPETGEP